MHNPPGAGIINSESNNEGSVMTIWNYLSLLGGLAVFLFSLIELNRNLMAMAGRKMKSVLMKLTKGPFRSYLTGFGITVLNQSSSATTVLEAAMVGAGYLTFQQSLAVTLGAELGATIFPQLVAIPGMTRLSSFFLIFGLTVSILPKKKRYRQTGLVFFSFGLLFLGLEIMTGALMPLRESPVFIRLMKNVEHPLLGILIGMAFTMIIQSAGATTGITIAMALSGTITLSQAVPINMGAAVGTCITAVLGSLPLNREAKRSAYAHFFFQLMAITWVYILLSLSFRGESLYIWWVKWFCREILHTEHLARQIAVGYTFIPVINHIILFPGLPFVMKLFNALFPEQEKPEPFGVMYIDENLISRSVALSLEMTGKEIHRVAEVVREMIYAMEKAFRNGDPDYREKISELDQKVDMLHETIITFLAKLFQEELSRKQSILCMDYIRIQNELELIGDVIDKNVMALIEKKTDEKLKFSEEGFQELKSLLERISINFEILIRTMEDVSDEIKTKNIRSILEDHKKRKEEKYKQSHIDRIHRGLTESIATSAVHLDLITYFSRINNHIVSIARRLQ